MKPTALKEFVGALSRTAGVLAQFAEPDDATTSYSWEGASFAPNDGFFFDYHAARWCIAFGTAAQLLRDQITPLSPSQTRYFEQALSGGDSSFTAFDLDQRRLSGKAKAARQELEQLKSILLTQFRKLQSRTELD